MTEPTAVTYLIDRDEARFGPTKTDEAALVWRLSDGPDEDALIAAAVDLDPSIDWLVRCDRVDFPPGAIAHTHTHPGPGIRCLLFGGFTVETEGVAKSYGPLGPWFESGPDPVYAFASADGPAAFVRVMLLPAEWRGKRTIRYVDPADADKPKTQRATVYFDEDLPR